jgi:hypothetical protein
MEHTQLAAILQGCLDQGFEPPLYVCAISVNGNAVVTRYAYHPLGAGMETTFLAEHTPEPDFILPINMMITDTRGEAVRVLLQSEGWRFADLN